MACLYAQNKNHLWAFFISAIAILNISCVKQPSTTEMLDSSEECSVIDDKTLIRDAFYNTGIGCNKRKTHKGPLLYAHFIEQSLYKDIKFEDILYNQNQSLICAPGPYLVEDSSSIDINKWQVTTMPDYFVWHLDDKILFEETFYITNQHGIPIKSQTVRLQNKNDATVVLLPKSKLTSGIKYYIYMILSNKNTRQAWIQPIELKEASL